MTVTLTRHGDLALVTIDNPPVNALGATVRSRLLALADVERAFRVEAARLQRILERRAQQARVECSFDVTRGQLLAEAIAREADLTVLTGRERPAAGDRAQGGGGVETVRAPRARRSH